MSFEVLESSNICLVVIQKSKSFSEVVVNLANSGYSRNLVKKLAMLPWFVAIILVPIAVLELIHTS